MTSVSTQLASADERMAGLLTPVLGEAHLHVQTELAVPVVLLEGPDLGLLTGPLGDAGGGGECGGHGGDARDRERWRPDGCGHRRLAAPGPRGVFTTRSTLPESISSTASMPSAPSPSLIWPITATAISPPPRGPGRPGGGDDREAELGEAPRGDQPDGLSRSASENNTCPRPAAGCRAALWLFANASPKDAVDAHDLAGGAHLRAEDRVDVGEPIERQHRFLHRDVATCRGRAEQPSSRSSASVAPTMTLAATLASGTPVALLTNGTVRLARGFASITKTYRPSPRTAR